ncbi:glycosyltransferase involved in cell wall biosynthesis [Blastococcus colisei]|uniref:Glycosyltransferase involved in cell wall biosynthesis n=1 Tax=Blastococcus colisei TaxID=1564162 RepID=A0A543PGC1_9ACTN|nr:glycosyltransferase family 4 protein [Blastococcus colisei]TQN43125.1 glycosyltransferase involved in cell wall biosynthesis [Blastococcus colisei]
MPGSIDTVVERHVLRLCSVFEPSTGTEQGAAGHPGELDPRATRFDPIGGMQNHTAALTRALDTQAVQQTVVTSRLAAPRSVTRLGQSAQVHRRGLPIPGLRQLWALTALAHVLRRPPAGAVRPVDLVHAHQGEDIATLLLARLAARRHRARLVVTVHCSVGHTLRGGTLRVRLLRSLGGVVERSTLHRADAVIVLTQRTAAALRSDGVDADRIHTIPSGFEPSLFTAAENDTRPPSARPRIGYVGRLAPQKRADLLVRAFGRMRRRAELVIVGDGPDRRRVAHLIRESPAADRITMTGFVEHSAVPGVLSSLDVLVLPSAYEEMGSVLVEAMAAGLPVVASDVGGIPEVVRHGETGLLVPPGDVDCLAETLDRLVADPQLRARLSAGARARARAYAWPALAARVTGVYAAVMEPDASSVPLA